MIEIAKKNYPINLIFTYLDNIVEKEKLYFFFIFKLILKSDPRIESASNSELCNFYINFVSTVKHFIGTLEYY